MPRKTSPKKVKRKPQKRKSPEMMGIKSMERTMETTTKMVGKVSIAGMGIGLAGAVLSRI